MMTNAGFLMVDYLSNVTQSSDYQCRICHTVVDEYETIDGCEVMQT